MLEIFNNEQWQKTVKDISHQQILSAQKIGYEHKNMVKLLKQE